MTGSDGSAARRLKQRGRQLVSPVMKRLSAALASGLTPQKCALTLCIGVALGIMPLIAGTTLICIILAHIFKLNQVALQSLNYLLYPVQLALLFPFFKMGAWLFPWGPPLPLHMFSTLIHNPGLSSVHLLAWLTLRSLAAWVVIVAPAALSAYVILRTTVFREKARIKGPVNYLRSEYPILSRED